MPVIHRAKFALLCTCLLPVLVLVVQGCAALADAEPTPEEPAPAELARTASVAFDELSIKAQCAELVMRYALYRDQRDTEAYVSLFTPDARLTINSDTYVGHDVLRARLSPDPDARQTTHLVSTVVIDVESSSQARGLSYVSVYVGAGAKARLLAIGEYHDRYVLTTGGWKIRERTFVAKLNPSQIPTS